MEHKLKNGDYIMFKILQETTVWNSEYTVYNHTYLLDPKDRILAYYNAKDKTIHQLKSPYVIDKKYRKFIETKNTKLSKLIPKDYKEETVKYTPSENIRIFKVKSKEKNREYIVEYNKLGDYYTCSCIGYGYRRKCRHVDAVAKKQQSSG